MDLDLDLFDRPRSHRRARARTRHRGWRRQHRHLFAWLVVAGGAVVLVGAVVALLTALGAWSALSSAYFSLAGSLLPAGWNQAFHAIPGWAHVAVALAAIFLITGLLGEIFD